MVLDNLPDILNIVIRRLENFLRPFEKNFTLKIGIFEPYTNRILRVGFSKIQTFVRFLPYNLFDVAYVKPILWILHFFGPRRLFKGS